MLALWIDLIGLVVKYGPWGLLAIAVGLIYCLVRILLDEDLSARWRARFYRAIYKISGRTEAEKKYIENDVASRINLSRRKMPFGKEHLPKAVKIQWFEGSTGEALRIKDNEVVVRLDPAEMQEENIVLLAEAFVKQTALVGIRHAVSEPLEVAMDLNLVKNLLKEIGEPRILDWYFRNQYKPTLDTSREIAEWNAKIVAIDEFGLFVTLLLVELDDYSRRVMGQPPSPRLAEEVVGLVGFLHKIATKAIGIDVPLQYTKPNISLGVILVGEKSKILLEGVEPYLKAFAYNLRERRASLYVIKFDRSILDFYTSTTYERLRELSEQLDDKIKQQFHIERQFQLEYRYTDPLGNRRKAHISRYVPHYDT